MGGIRKNDYGIIYASFLVGNLREVKDSQAREEIRKIVDSEEFVKSYYERVVSEFSPNLKQLILPYVGMEAAVPITIPASATLYNPFGDKYYIKAGFNLESDSAEEFLNFLRIVNFHTNSLKDMFVNLIQDFLGKELLETKHILQKFEFMI